MLQFTIKMVFLTIFGIGFVVIREIVKGFPIENGFREILQKSIPPGSVTGGFRQFHNDLKMVKNTILISF